jgi:hypothetical protein
MQILSTDGRISLMMITGFIERYLEELKEHTEAEGETYKSEIDPYYYDKESEPEK